MFNPSCGLGKDGFLKDETNRLFDSLASHERADLEQKNLFPVEALRTCRLINILNSNI